METRYASRKFILASFAMLAALGLLLGGQINQDTWSDFSVTVLLLYTAGNVGSYFVAKAVKP